MNIFSRLGVTLLAIPVWLAISVCIANAQVASDMPGSKDHPDIPRVQGSRIIGYAYSSYDENFFITGMEDREIQGESSEGERTRIMYLGGADMSPLGILRNYQKALGDLGTVTEKFYCKDSTCYSNLADVHVWNANNQIPTVFETRPQSIYRYSKQLYRSQSYWYGTTESAESLYHVSVYTSVRTDGGFRDHNQILSEGATITHVEIIKVEDFSPTLEVVTSEEMAAQLGKTGHIAVYGLYFDADSAELRSDSKPALGEIAKTLQADSALSLYVVGHTDNQGGVEYNESLSERRAASVVSALTSEFDIAPERLFALGAGLAAPVALNDNEDGRALNRRVELVKR